MGTHSVWSSVAICLCSLLLFDDKVIKLKNKTNSRAIWTRPSTVIWIYLFFNVKFNLRKQRLWVSFSCNFYWLVIALNNDPWGSKSDEMYMYTSQRATAWHLSFWIAWPNLPCLPNREWRVSHSTFQTTWLNRSINRIESTTSWIGVLDNCLAALIK